MNVIVAGTRTFTSYSQISWVLCLWRDEMDCIFSGGATGVDALGERFARENNIKLCRFPADWRKHGKAAGPIRNREMASAAHMLIAIWDGKSKGTKNMIDTAEKMGLHTLIFTYGEDGMLVGNKASWMDTQSADL